MILEIPKYFTKDDFRIVGIYFLVKDNRVVYIGQTVNVINRISQHPEKDFDSVRLISCSVTLLDYYERRLIRLFRPKYNLLEYNMGIGKTRSIRIPKETDKKLQKRAKSQGRSINSQIVYELDTRP